jgi:Kef-type K+ transport system membrane component KefB
MLGRLSNWIGIAPLAGYIVAGAVLGPPLAVSVPFAPALSLIGEVGLYLLVVEAGFEIELEILQAVGLRAVLASVAGMLLGAGPLALIVARVGLHLPWPAALAVAACLTPCSSGIALTSLKKFRALNTPLGQLVVSTALAEDLISLTMLRELRVLRNPRAAASAYVVPIFVSLGYALVVGAAAVFAIPLFLRTLITRLPSRYVDTAILLLLFCTTVGLVAACSAGGASPLLGAFLAGLSFCEIRSTSAVWRHQVKRIQGWMVRLFFASTVGFSIPIQDYRRPIVWRNAVVLYAATWGKLVAGAFAEPFGLPEALALGFAMSTLGEFSFIMGATALHDLQLLTPELYASVALATLLTIFVSPVMLSFALRWMARRAESALAEANKETEAVFYKLDIKTLGHWGLVGSIIETLKTHDCSIIDFRVSSEPPFALYEAFLRDERMRSALAPTLLTEQAASPEALVRALPPVPGLPARLTELRAALLVTLAHDKQAADTDKDEEASLSEAQNAATIDFGALRGLVLRRWLPSSGGEAGDEPPPPGWENGGAAEPLPSEGGPAAPLASRAVDGGGRLRVARGSGLDGALARMRAHRAADAAHAAHRAAKDATEAQAGAIGGGGGSATSHARPLVVRYDAGDAASVDRVVALAHAAMEREAAAVAARDRGLLGDVRHLPARGCASSASEESE